MKSDEILKPFLKWAGGKRWFVSGYSHLFPENYKNYLEPFLGSGAVFFHLQPKRAIISDSNEDLINTYRVIRSNWKNIVKILKRHRLNHSKKYYYELRDSIPRGALEKAARFIYLNRTCWNGLYRVNLNGKFNVPKGTKTKSNVITKNDNYEAISNLLKKTVIKCEDFISVINKAKKGDLLFVDPPYTVKHNNNNFVKYNEKLFSWEDQIKLKKCLTKAQKRGAYIILTNAYNSSVVNLYKKDFFLQKLFRSSVIAASPDNRGQTEELLVLSKNLIN
jgi:DNA adenine methylase